MARDIRQDNGRFHAQGCYEKLLPADCGCDDRWKHDPRLRLNAAAQADRDVWDWLQAECRWRSNLSRQERLVAGWGPFEVAKWQFGGHHIPRQESWSDWLTKPAIYGGAHTVRIYADDTVEAAEFLARG